MEPRRAATRRSLVLVLAVALAVRLVNIYEMSRLPAAEYQFRAPEADMALAYEWSGRIVHGDLLGRETVHQYASWMREIAPLETWNRWWGGAHTFTQAPLYAYTLAGFRLLAGDHFWSIALCQALLGLANVALVFLLAKRLFGDDAASLAGLAAALYGPLQLYELFALRDTLGITVSLLMLWGLVRCDRAEPRRWLLAGFLLAVAALAREATLLFLPLVAFWMLRRFHADRRALARAALAFFAGVVLGFSPLIARNIAVGGPPFALAQSGIEVFIHGNAPGSAGFGWRVPPETRSILERADGHLATAVRFTLASYDGDWRRFLSLQILKLRAIFSSYEAIDNINWYYYADRFPLLRFSLHFEHVLALGLIGLWIAGRTGGRDRILRYFLLSALGTLMYSLVIGRYRLPGTAVLLVYAGAALQWAIGRIIQREWRPLAFASVAAVGIVVVSTHLLRAAELRMRYFPSEYASNAALYYGRGQITEAYLELRRGLEKAYVWPDHTALPPPYVALARQYVDFAHTLHRDAEAVAELEQLAAAFPTDAALVELIATVRAPNRGSRRSAGVGRRCVELPEHRGRLRAQLRRVRLCGEGGDELPRARSAPVAEDRRERAVVDRGERAREDLLELGIRIERRERAPLRVRARPVVLRAQGSMNQLARGRAPGPEHRREPAADVDATAHHLRLALRRNAGGRVHARRRPCGHELPDGEELDRAEAAVGAVRQREAVLAEEPGEDVAERHIVQV